MGMGDEIVAAGQAQRHFDLTGERSTIVDRQHKPRWHPIWENNPVIIPPAEASYGHEHRIINGPNARPYIVYPFTAESGWTFNREFRCRDHVAKIYLTDEEHELGICAQAMLGPYVLIEPWSKHANLRWPWPYWEQLIASMPHVTFVQHTHKDSLKVVPGAHGVLTTSFREACGLVASAACYVRGESGMCHAAAALGIPQVTIWGGCMDFDVMGGYPGQFAVGISTPCCGRYNPCPHCADSMTAISPAVVAAALDKQLSASNVVNLN